MAFYRFFRLFPATLLAFSAFMVPESNSRADEAVSLSLARKHLMPGQSVTYRLSAGDIKAERAKVHVSVIKNGSNVTVFQDSFPLQGASEHKFTLPKSAPYGDYRIAVEIQDSHQAVLGRNGSADGFIVAGAQTPLPFQVHDHFTAKDLIDKVGVVTALRYQSGPERADTPWDLPNRNGEKEVIAALTYLGVHHIRNGTLQSRADENKDRPHPGANGPTDFENFLNLKRAIPDLKLDLLIDAGGPPHWGDGSDRDPKPIIATLARMNALASLEAPNEPNFQPTFSPAGRSYLAEGESQRDMIRHIDHVWQDWGEAMRAFKRAEPVLENVLLLPPSSAMNGPNGPDGVEVQFAVAGVKDHTALYDRMNIHAYSLQGLHLGAPEGDISQGNPPNWAALPVSLPNWGRYVMPGRPVIVTETGANMAPEGPRKQRLSAQAQALSLSNSVFWAAYYGAERVYLYQLVDDTFDENDANSGQWGLFRGNWSAKPSADYLHRLLAALHDGGSGPARPVPEFTVTGQNPTSRGATILASKSDGGSVILCNNVLAYWDRETGKDIRPSAEHWQVHFAVPVAYRVIDIASNAQAPVRHGKDIDIEVAGYPKLIELLP